MICKNCRANNDPEANFCAYCGGELYKSTLVTSPVAEAVTPSSAPTAGLRIFSGFSGTYLRSPQPHLSSVSSAVPRSDAYHSHPTGAKARIRKDGMWICPDCGELNGHEKLWCTGCGKYR